MAVSFFFYISFCQKKNTAVATIFQYSATDTGRLRRRTSDELLSMAPSRHAAGPTEVLEASINFIGISGYPGIYRMTLYFVAGIASESPAILTEFFFHSRRWLKDFFTYIFREAKAGKLS